MTKEQGAVAFPLETSPVASVVVIGFRTAPFLLDCLGSLRASVREVPYEVIVVLNQPSRELGVEVDTRLSGARVLRSSVNVGFGGAVNLAASETRGEFLVLLNDDTEVQEGWLEALVEMARRRPDAGAVASTMLFPDGSIQERGSVIWADGSTITVGRGLPGDSFQYGYERRVDFGSGGALLVRRELFAQVGGMDPRYFPAYYEDVDLCLRFAELGWTTWLQPRAKVLHYESMSTNETFRHYLFMKNRALFVDRWQHVLDKREPAAPTDPIAVAHAAWRAAGALPQVLFIDDQVPDAGIGSGYPRMADALRSVAESGRYHLVSFTSLVDGARVTDLTVELGLEVLDGFTPEDLETHLRQRYVPFEAVVISRPHNFERFAPVIRALSPDTPIIYDAEALFHRRLERQAALGGGEPVAEEAAEMKQVEAQIASEADLLVAISEQEAAFMRENTSAPVHIHSPLLVGLRPGRNGFHERADIAFVAGWAWGIRTPNVDALQWFARDVFPEILARSPGARLLVTGSNAPEPVLRLAGPSLVFTGRVANLEELYNQVRVVIVPMRFGAGVKNKTVEALQYGVPTVATTVGAEGLELDEPDSILVDDSPSGFAFKVATLLDEPDTWELQRLRILRQHDVWAGKPRSEVWPGVLDEARAADRPRCSGSALGARTGSRKDR